jgi:hypothetical protein
MLNELMTLAVVQPLILDQLMPPTLPGAAVTTNTVCVTLAWDAVTNAGVTGYRLYWGSSHLSYTNSVGTQATNATVCGLGKTNTYYFAVTATNNADMESDFSSEVVFPVPVTNVIMVSAQLLTKPSIGLPWQVMTNNIVYYVTNPPVGQLFSSSLSIAMTNTAYFKVLKVNSSSIIFTNK